MAPKVKTRADFPKGPEGTKAFKNYKLSKLYRTIKGKKVAKNALKIGQKKLLGKGLLASAMIENVRLGVKQATIKDKKGNYKGYVGLAQKGVRGLKNFASKEEAKRSKRDEEMRAKGFVKNKRGRWVKKRVVKTNLPNAKKTSAAIRAEQKKNDKSTNVKKVEKKVVKDKPANKLKINAEKKAEKKVEKKDPLKDYRRGPGTKLGKDTRITKGLKKAGFTEDRLARLRKKHAEFKARRKKKKTLFRK